MHRETTLWGHRRTWPSTHQGENPQNQPCRHRDLGGQPPGLEAINVCGLSPPLCGTLLGQPEETHAPALTDTPCAWTAEGARGCPPGHLPCSKPPPRVLGGCSHSPRPGSLGSAPPSWPIWTHPPPSMGPTVAPTLSALTCFPSAGSALPTYTFLQEGLPDHAGRTASHSPRWQLPFSWRSHSLTEEQVIMIPKECQ